MISISLDEFVLKIDGDVKKLAQYFFMLVFLKFSPKNIADIYFAHVDMFKQYFYSILLLTSIYIFLYIQLYTKFTIV